MAVRRDRPDPAFFIGSGKVEEIKAQAIAAGAGFVVFDVALSPAQQRNLERALDLRSRAVEAISADGAVVRLAQRQHVGEDDQLAAGLRREFSARGLTESESRDAIAARLEEVRVRVNGRVKPSSRIDRIIEQPEPFEKTPTLKIKRYLYV